MSYRVANPVEPGNRQAGPSGKPERVDTTPGQQHLKPVREIRRHRYGPPRRAGKGTLRHGAVHYIAARRQPQTPSRQPRLDIGHHGTVRADHKAQKAGAVAHLAGDDAAALRRYCSLRRPIYRLCRRRMFLVKRRRLYSFAPGSISAPASSNQ